MPSPFLYEEIKEKVFFLLILLLAFDAFLLPGISSSSLTSSSLWLSWTVYPAVIRTIFKCSLSPSIPFVIKVGVVGRGQEQKDALLPQVYSAHRCIIEPRSITNIGKTYSSTFHDQEPSMFVERELYIQTLIFSHLFMSAGGIGGRGISLFTAVKSWRRMQEDWRHSTNVAGCSTVSVPALICNGCWGDSALFLIPYWLLWDSRALLNLNSISLLPSSSQRILGLTNLLHRHLSCLGWRWRSIIHGARQVLSVKVSFEKYAPVNQTERECSRNVHWILLDTFFFIFLICVASLTCSGTFLSQALIMIWSSTHALAPLIVKMRREKQVHSQLALAITRSNGGKKNILCPSLFITVARDNQTF